ncbi:hypothetical protein GGE24_001691 [Bradyrhizobium centrosematis]|nr:hypothetical protein [Bradyrhizobium centrosematis]MCS3772379.1 hypothetical protein [Bradyrhizobium centrosematis]
MAGSVAKNVIGRLHLEQIRTGGLSFATQIIAKMPKEGGHIRRMLRGVHLGVTTGVYRNLARLFAHEAKPVLRAAWTGRQLPLAPDDGL